MIYLTSTLKLQDLYGYQISSDTYRYIFSLPPDKLELEDTFIAMLDMSRENDCKIFNMKVSSNYVIPQIEIITEKRAQNTELILVIIKK